MRNYSLCSEGFHRAGKIFSIELYIFPKINLLLCLHFVKSSVLLLRLEIPGLKSKKYFSLLHRLHILVAVLYGVAFSSCFHFISNLLPLFLISHIWLDNVVSCIY